MPCALERVLISFFCLQGCFDRRLGWTARYHLSWKLRHQGMKHLLRVSAEPGKPEFRSRRTRDEHIQVMLCVRSEKGSFSSTEETSQPVSPVFRDFGAVEIAL